MEKLCVLCGNPFQTRRRVAKYCGTYCSSQAPRSVETRLKQSESTKGKPKSAAMRAKLSASTTGKPKPWMLGAENVNFGGVLHTVEVRQRMSDTRKLMGSTWTPAHCEAHRQRMLGDSNVMRGTNHTPEMRAKLSEIKKRQYRDGKVNVRNYKVSKPERDIAAWLLSHGIEFKPQYHIPGVPFWYDFYLPALGLLVEFQGDYWHANPRRYNPGTHLKFHRRGSVMVEDIWQRDAEKRQAGVGAGFRVAYIWEMDFNRDGLEDTMAKVLR